MDISLKPSEAKQALNACIEANRAVILWGSPGVGKSQIIKQVATKLSLECKDIRAVLLDPVDLRGLPHINGDGRAHWAVPDFLPRDGEGIIFLDELNRAPILVQNACFQLVLDRKLGEYELPTGWRILAACNRESDGGGINRLPSALANRFMHLNLTVDLDDWCNWATESEIAGGPSRIDPTVIGFLRFRPNLLNEFSRETYAFPTPRSWEFVSSIVSQNLKPDIEMALVAGAVGEGAAVEFEASVRLFRKLPSLDVIIMDPQNSPVPDDVATLYAVSAGLATRAKAENLGRITTYLKRIPPEYSVYCIRDAINRDESLSKTPEFTRWAVEHADII